MNMKIRGSTQLLDDSVPLEKLSPELQERLLREQKRADFVATAGQTVLSHADFASGMPTYVYLNGVMLQPNEFSVSAGSITLTAPAELNDQITVLYGISNMPGAFGTFDASLTYTYTGTMAVAPFAMQTAPVVPTADGKEFAGLLFMPNIGSGVTGIEFPKLAGVSGNFSPGNMAALTSLSLPALANVGGGFQPHSMAALTSLSLPALANVGGNCGPINMAALTSLSLPALTNVGSQFNPTGMSALTSLSLPALTSVGGGFSPNSMAALTSLSLPALTNVGGSFGPNAMIGLTSLSLPVIAVLSSGISLANLTGALTTLEIGASLKVCSGNINITSAALNQASVDNLLVRLAALDGTNGTMIFGTGRTVTITGTSATPSATGLAAKAVLQARGVTVTHN